MESKTIKNRGKIVPNIDEKILSFIDNEIRECFFKENTSTYDAEIIELKDKKFIKKYVVVDAFKPKEKKKYSLEEIFADFVNLNISSNDSIKTFVNKYGVLNNFCIIEKSSYKKYLLMRKIYFSNLYVLNVDKTKAWKIHTYSLSEFGIRGKPRYIGDFLYRDISPLIGKNLYIGELIDITPRNSDNHANNIYFQTYNKPVLSESLEFSWADLQNYTKKFYEKINSNSKKTIDILNEFPLNLFLVHFGGYLVYKNLNLIKFDASLGNKFIDSVLEIFSKEYIGTKIKICLNPKCKKIFIPKSSKAKFCSDKCRYLFNKM